MKYQDVIDQIPDYEVFLTVDELDAHSKALAEEYPDVVELKELGKSRQGHPIYGLKIGDGPHNAIMFACPHPNEPMGAMMLDYFRASSRKMRNTQGAKLHLVSHQEY